MYPPWSCACCAMLADDNAIPAAANIAAIDAFLINMTSPVLSTMENGQKANGDCPAKPSHAG
jgi:hypothetical protein